MLLTGKFEVDDNFITLFADNKVYTLAYGGDWGSVEVPGKSAFGLPLTQKWYDDCVAKCTKTGTFRVDEYGWKRIR